MTALRLILFIGGLALLSTQAWAVTAFAGLKDGERLRYQIGWGVFSHAGEVVIEARRGTLESKPVSHVSIVIASRGMIRSLFKFESRTHLVVDAATGAILRAHDTGISGSDRLDARTDFDYLTRRAFHRDLERPERNRDFPIPEGVPMDLISALIETREWRPKVGDHRDALVYFGRDLYSVVLRAEAYESLKTPLGTFDTVCLVPRMENEPPRGVFKRGGEIKVWVSRDATPQPIRMQLNLSFGTARLTLVERSVASSTSPVP
ncbi:MAG TPA: DUF3108 domain-containing protein [Opitutaceae bacterium]|nr:DUF3108 domain-containing protein [Opitutaceae bacterium]